ncbi:MAG: hypothetical protein WED07_01025 [Candidatus Freyarchaeum deiterrae]
MPSTPSFGNPLRIEVGRDWHQTNDASGVKGQLSKRVEIREEIPLPCLAGSQRPFEELFVAQ